MTVEPGLVVCRVEAIPLEQVGRYRDLREVVARSIRDVRELPDGWAVELAASPEVFLAAAEWITLERVCCPFLEFDLGWAPARQYVQLRLRGPEAAKALVGEALAGRRPGR